MRLFKLNRVFGFFAPRTHVPPQVQENLIQTADLLELSTLANYEMHAPNDLTAYEYLLENASREGRMTHLFDTYTTSGQTASAHNLAKQHQTFAHPPKLGK